MLAYTLLRRTLVTLLGCALALVGWLLLTPASPVAATQHVTDCADTGTNTLRGIISSAPTGDTIVYDLACSTTLGSTLTLTKNVTISGPTSGTGVIVDGGGAHTVFLVNVGVTASISNLTITNGLGGSGGGILNDGSLTVTNTTFTANVAPNSGGGIFNNSGTLFVTNSTFSGNSAPGNDGGGIVNFNSGTLTVRNSTFTGNSAARGGGIQNLGSTVTVTNTIVAGNSATSFGPDVAGGYTSGGHNLIGKTDGSSGWVVSDHTGTVLSPLNAVLGALGSDGGTTQTIPLLAGSPAIGGVPPANCTLITDQRGLPRSASGVCAIGAFEPQQATYFVGSVGDGGAMDTLQNCQTLGNMTCKVRDALAYASSSGTDTIQIGTCDFCTFGTIRLQQGNGGLVLAASVTIEGAGWVVDGGCTFSGGVCTSGGAGTVFTINSGVTAVLIKLQIQHGNFGGIGNNGTLTINQSTITSNSAGGGGGIGNAGTLFVTNSTITGNGANQGSGIANGGTLFVTNSTIAANIGLGGGNGGGIENVGGTVNLTNTIVAGNSAGDGSGPDLAGTFTSHGHNLIGDITGSTGISDADAQGDIVNNTPLLGPLGKDGYLTPAISLLAGSPAIGAVPHANCTLTTDQRGLPRSTTGVCAIGAFEPQQAAYTVGNALDTGAMDTLENCQTEGNTTCKLRDALAYASSGLDTITILPVLTGGQKITLTNDAQHGTLTLAASVTVIGPTSGAGVIVDGGCTGCDPGQTPNGGVRVFLVNSGVTASLSNLTIQHGNSTSGSGGGIRTNGGTVTVTNSTITGNSTSGSGGGIFNNGGTVTVTNSTITGNSAVGSGGGIRNSGALHVTNSTLTGNSASTGGGIYHNGMGVMPTVRNTIVAGSTSGGDLSGTFTGNNNLIDDGTFGALSGTGNLNPANALLGTLGSNGGTTQTIPLLPGSPAIAHGDPAICNATTGTAPVNHLDQCGVTRPAALCAIGAVEPLLSAISPSSGLLGGGTVVSLTGAGFVAGATVSIGGVSCTNVVVVNLTTLTCTTGAHAAGAVDVVVTVGSATGTLTGGYTYGTVNPLPGSAPTGGAAGGANPLPVSRPAGTTGGVPNPLPAARP